MPGLFNAFGSKSDREKTKSTRLENKAQSKQEKETTRLNEQKEKAERKASNIKEYTDRAKTAKENQASVLVKEAEEKENEKKASVLDGLTLAATPGQTPDQIAKCYSNVVDDLLNLNDNNGNEQGLEEGEGKLIATIEDRVQDSQALNNATPEQLTGLKGELEKRIKSIREGGDKKTTEAKNTDYTRTLRQIERSGDRDTRKQERKLVRFLRQVQNHVGSPSEKAA